MASTTKKTKKKTTSTKPTGRAINPAAHRALKKSLLAGTPATAPGKTSKKTLDPALAKAARDGIAEIDARMKANEKAAHSSEAKTQYPTTPLAEAIVRDIIAQPESPVTVTIKPKARKERTAKKVSALDAAAKILEATGQPMRPAEIVDEAARRDLWKSPGGKTPAASLHAAITREIAAKGSEARFTKTGRGYFAFRKAG
jgi:hypothetical protein